MARRRGRTLPRLLIGAVALVALLGAWMSREITGAGSSTDPVTVVIPRGSSVRAISDSLANAGIIASPRAFRLYASMGQKDRAIKPGQYEFVQGQGWSSVLATLVKGRGASRTVVIPEGFDLRDIAPVLAKALGVPQDSVRVAASDAEWRRKLQVPAETLEGYLFPATYTFAVGTTAREAVTAMLERFETVWKPEWNARLTELNISRHEAMTMASIVEKEARKAEERPIISAVYWNRVKKRMPLQADPTVQYALPEHTERVLYKDLEVDSPYNTYRNAGLPPGPIASPGEASIAAALAPANVPYLYFVAHPDGHHEFRTTFAEHERAIAEVRRAARAAAGRPATRPK
ncbi:MAG: endolytic transglycosylase MltG [Gemmatimonadota bacterium]